MGLGLKKNTSRAYLNVFTEQMRPAAAIKAAQVLAWPSANILLKHTASLFTCAVRRMLAPPSDLPLMPKEINYWFKENAPVKTRAVLHEKMLLFAYIT